MSKSFEQVLKEICEKLLLSDKDRESYAKDAQSIQNFIIEEMKALDDDFRRAFKGLSLTGSYLDDLKIHMPDEFDVHIKLQLYNITPQADKSRPGFLHLQVGERVRHSTVENGWVNRKYLQYWIRELLKGVLARAEKSRVKIDTLSGRRYMLTYSKSHRGYAVAHTIEAQDINDSTRRIDFDLVPVFEFEAKEWCLPVALPRGDLHWFAVPKGTSLKDSHDSKTFMACAPHHERELLHNKMHLKNSLRLMKAIKDANGLPCLTSYMLKSVYLMQLRERSDEYWTLPMGYILLDMLQCVLSCLEKEYLPFYWNPKRNHLEVLRSSDINAYRAKVSEILCRLKNLKDGRYLAFADVATIFGVK